MEVKRILARTQLLCIGDMSLCKGFEEEQQFEGALKIDTEGNKVNLSSTPLYGRQYTVEGEVSIDTSSVTRDTDTTVRKAQNIKLNTLAP